MVKTFEQTSAYDKKSSIQEELSELKENITPIMKLEGKDIPSYWWTNVVKLGSRHSEKYQLQVIGDNRNYVFAREIDDEKLEKDGSKYLVESRYLSEKVFSSNDIEMSKFKYNFFVHKDGTEYVVTVEKETNNEDVTAETTKNEPFVEKNEDIIPEFPIFSTVKTKDSIEGYSFLLSPTVTNNEVKILIKSDEGKQLYSDPISLDENKWIYNINHKAFVYDNFMKLSDTTSAALILNNSDDSGMISFIKDTELLSFEKNLDKTIKENPKKKGKSTNSEETLSNNKNVIVSGSNNSPEIVPQDPILKFAPYVLSSDGSEWMHTSSDIASIISLTNKKGSVRINYITPTGRLNTEFLFANNGVSILQQLKINRRSIKSNIVTVNSKMYSVTLTNKNGTIYTTINEEFIATTNNKTESKEVLMNSGIRRYTGYIEGDNSKLQKLKIGNKEKKIRGYYKDDISYVGNETLVQGAQDTIDNLHINNIDAEGTTYKLSRKRDVPGGYGGKLISDKEAEFTIDEVRDEFTSLGKGQWIGKIPSIDHPGQNWEIKVTLKPEKYGQGEDATVMKVDIINIPEHLKLSEEDEILQPEGIVWMSSAKKMQFDKLPTMGKGVDKKKIRGYQNGGIEYDGGEKLTPEQKVYLDSMRVTHREDRIKKDDLQIFGLFAPQFGQTIISDKICEIDFSKHSRFVKIPGGWRYTTIQNGTNEEVVLKIITREENLTQLYKGPVFKVVVEKVGESFGKKVEISKNFGLDLNDFPTISQKLKDAFKDIGTLQDAIDWLKDVFDFLDESDIEKIGGIKLLEGEDKLNIGGVTPTHYDPIVRPMAGVTQSDLDKIIVFDKSGSNDIKIEHQDAGALRVDLDLFNIDYLSNNGSDPITGTSSEFEITVGSSGKIVKSKREYELRTTKVIDTNGDEKDTLRISVKPSKEYLDAVRSSPILEPGLETLKGKLMYPTKDKFPIGSRYGVVRNTGRHKGIDIDVANDKGYETVAVYPGKVYQVVRNSPTYGTYIIVHHEINGKKFRTLYAHLDERTINLNSLDKVEAGDVLGKTEIRAGKMGRSSGPHLHFELRVKEPGFEVNPGGNNPNINDGWRDIDPEPYLANGGGAPKPKKKPTGSVVPKFSPSIIRKNTDVINGKNVVDIEIEMDLNKKYLKHLDQITLTYTKPDNTKELILLSAVSLPNSPNRHPTDGSGNIEKFKRVIPNVLDVAGTEITLTSPLFKGNDYVYTL